MTTIFLVIILICLVFVFLHKDKPTDNQQQQDSAKRVLSAQEREAIRQADEAFDWSTHNAIVEGTYNGPLPEHDGIYWSNLYPNIYHTKIAGINFCRGIKNLAGIYKNGHGLSLRFPTKERFSKTDSPVYA